MRIEGGSQNLSRIPGQYVYPVRRYDTSPVPSVDGVGGRRASRREAVEAMEPAVLERMDPSLGISATGRQGSRGGVGGLLDITDLRRGEIAPAILESYTPGGISNSGLYALGGNLDLVG